MSQNNPTVKVFIPDETYPFSMEDEESKALSANFLKGLEAEFQADFFEANIGAGADIPAFGTLVDVGIVAAALFKGAEIIGAWDAWSSAYKKLHKFFHRKPVFDKNAAAIVALNHIVHTMGKPPKAIQLRGYSAEILFMADGDTIPVPLEIDDGVADLSLGTTTHVFNIAVDGQNYVARVNGPNVTLHEIG